MSQSLVGQTLKGRYEVFKSLNSGGFGDTYLAYDCDLPVKPKRVVKHLAPKALDPKDFHLAERLFKQEAELLYKLGEQHDQIPFLYAYFEEEGQFYLVQEFIEGHDLSHEIPPGKKLGEGETLELLDEILSVLSFVHENGVIHRDIKPQNIMRRERDGKLFLIDFGAVKEINVMTTDGTGQTSLTVGIGSPGFMPSEQAAGRPKLSSDVYAVGMIGVNCVTGVQPSQLNEDKQTGELMWQHLAQVSERTSQFLQTMVRDHFSQRFETATVAHSALSSLSKSEKKTEPIVEEETPIPPTGRYEPTPPVEPPTIKNEPIQPERQSRRGFLTLLGWGGLGLGGAWLYGVIQNSTSTSTSGNEPIDNPVASPVKGDDLSSLANQTFSFNTVRVDERGEVVERIDGSADYFEEDLGNAITLDMVMIPGGTFTMGSPSSEVDSEDDERPQHEVSIPSFAMGRYAVTQAQWQAIMGNNPSHFKGDRRPVEQVNWNEAIEFCKKLSNQSGKDYRLPSEAEWEYACRAGTITPFHFGETVTSDLVNCDGKASPYAQAPKGEYRQQTTEVGSFPPNAYGLYDMHGNMWEWCLDHWHKNYNGAPTDGSAWVTEGDSRILRGGSWFNFPRYCRSAFRFDNLPGDRYC